MKLMEAVLRLQAELAEKYGYKPLPVNDSKVYRELYRRTIPKFLKIDGSDDILYNFSQTLIAHGYERIVIGDYGAFVEFNQEQANPKAYITKSGEEYRSTERYAPTVKYEWLTTRDSSDVKIYLQRRTVPYADYKSGYFYISVFEVWACSGFDGVARSKDSQERHHLTSQPKN